jgi:hypothetical protein
VGNTGELLFRKMMLADVSPTDMLVCMGDTRGG